MGTDNWKNELRNRKFLDGASKGNQCKCGGEDYRRLKGELGGKEYARNSKKFWKKLWIYLWRGR